MEKWAVRKKNKPTVSLAKTPTGGVAEEMKIKLAMPEANATLCQLLPL